MATDSNHPLKFLMKKFKISSTDLSKELGITKASLYARLNDKVKMKPKDIETLSKKFNVPAEFFSTRDVNEIESHLANASVTIEPKAKVKTKAEPAADVKSKAKPTEKTATPAPTHVELLQQIINEKEQRLLDKQKIIELLEDKLAALTSGAKK